MADSLLEQAERLATLCRATLDSPSGNPLRTANMISEHRQMVAMLEELIEFQHGYESIHQRLLRLVKNLLDASSTGSNGTRSWRKDLPQPVKTVLILIHEFIKRRR